MKIEGVFRKWEIGPCRATYNDTYCVWIANGFCGFKDRSYTTEKPFLSGLGLFIRWRLWREMKRERRRRSVAAIILMVGPYRSDA